MVHVRAGMGGRNVPESPETPPRGVGADFFESGPPTPAAGMPERNTPLKGGTSNIPVPCQTGTRNALPEYSGPGIPAIPAPKPNTVAAVYADGGLIASNPSPIAGMWAFCHVDAENWRVHEESGVLVPQEVGGPVTNHHSEVLAMLFGLEALPDGWSGQACSDSKNALRLFFHEGSLRAIPDAWRPRVGAVLRRLGRIEPVHLDGHPTRAQLAAGIGKRGNPVSEHNVRVDALCSQEGRRYQLVQTAGATR
jgi:hypothetical protein